METLVLLKPHPSALLNSTVVESWTAKPEIAGSNLAGGNILFLECYHLGNSLMLILPILFFVKN